jgi:hypothetical protein
VLGGHKALDHLTIFQVRFDDLINVCVVNVRVPNPLGINHRHRAARTPVKAAGLVHPNFAGARQTKGLDLGFATVKSGLCIVLGTARLIVFALIEAKKDVPLEIGWGLGSAHPAILGLLG